jgi:SAM-dependent methyltransferase
MTDWTSGYVADIGYTYGYYTELNPLRLKLIFANAGLVCPDVGTACELGFGQGVSTNIHAAASHVAWHGTDFNPSQASFAQELALASGAQPKLCDDAFADYAQRSDLPDFDYIGIHGIWSWISDDNRAVMVDFIRRKLKVGGVLYISYNTLPGWSAFAPMRHLMTEHADILGTEGRGIVHRIDGALDFAEKLIATNPAYTRANPHVAERLNGMKGHNRHYLAHEYFNRDWHPMHFATMADWLEPAKLQFAGSANFSDYVDGINLTPEQKAFLQEIPDAMFRQTVRDFMVNQQFRKDYWVKGLRKQTALDQADTLRGIKVILTSHRLDISLKLTGALGEATMSETIYTPLLDYLADHKIRSIGQIEHAVKDVKFPQIVEAMLLLAGAGHLQLAQEDSIANRSRKPTDKLNAHLANQARSHGDIGYLGSPVSGGGISVPRFVQLFIQGHAQGKKQAADLAQFVWQILASQGQKIVKDGKTLETVEDNLAELTQQATAFLEKQLPILKALQIA